MKTEQTPFSKTELKIYILLLCAKADLVETKEELDLIKSKTSSATFEKMYSSFCDETEDESLDRIHEILANHEYSYRELTELKKEVQDVFISDKKVDRKEYNLGQILDNILF